MPRYFFETSINGIDTTDHSGFVLDDDDTARAKAEAILDSIAHEAPGACTVSVRNEAGLMIAAKVAIKAF